MTPTKFLFIKRLSRYPQTGAYDELLFSKGVNVIVGQPNTGKTKWLQMLDYLWGDPSPAKDAFDEDLVEKYDRIEAIIEIDQKEYVFERRWKEKGNIGKVFIDGEGILVEDFSAKLLEMLNMPIIHFPSGNPYSSRKWPVLSWRELYRHIYRRQDSWSDLATRQPESTQLACILYFLGIAENIYSDTYGEVVSLNKQIGSLESAKDQFSKIMARFSNDLIDHDFSGQNLTRTSLKELSNSISFEETEMQVHREKLLTDLKSIQNPNIDQNVIKELGSQWEVVQDNLNQIRQKIIATRDRLIELEEYKISVDNEYTKLKRARIAGSIMADLRVTHCPVCDKSVVNQHILNYCYLCKEPHNSEEDEYNSQQRLDFEFARLELEKSESDDLVSHASKELDEQLKSQKHLLEESENIKRMMRPIQRASAVILPPELAVIDNKLGVLSERKRQIERLENTLNLRQELIDETNKLIQRRDILEKDLEAKTSSIDFDESASDLSNNINYYLNGEIRKINPRGWTQDIVSVTLRERSFTIKVGDKSWRKLGGTMSLYFLMGYNYALLRLSHSSSYRYPGLLILDMPPKFGDTQVTRDETESFIIAPFVRIYQQTRNENYQVIVAGSKFEDLENVNRIELDTVWT